jgi:hypothetical protein
VLAAAEKNNHPTEEDIEKLSETVERILGEGR